MDYPVNILPYDGEVYYFPEVFTREEREMYFHSLIKEIQWKQEPIKLFGREIMQPRLTAWYGEAGRSYTYSGITMHAIPWTESLLKIKFIAEQLSASQFNSALLNLYRNGQDSMGWHRDNEKALGQSPAIASVSFGAKRRFQFRNYANKSTIRNVELLPGSVLVMRGLTQHNWEHRLPKVAKADEPRINITFRCIS